MSFSYDVSSWSTMQPNAPLFAKMGSSDSMGSTNVDSDANQLLPMAPRITSSNESVQSSVPSAQPFSAQTNPPQSMDSILTSVNSTAPKSAAESVAFQNQTYRPDLSKQLADARVLVPNLPVQSSTDGYVVSKVTNKQETDEESEARIVALEHKLSAFPRSDNGLTDENNMPAFMNIMKEENHTESRSHLISVLTSSGEQVLQAFVNQKGLDICDQWLKENNVELAMMVINLLQQLPINMQALKENGKIGKTVKKLAGSPEKRLKRVASKLLQDWKQLVERDISGTVARKRNLDGKSEPVVKRPKLTASKAFKTKGDETSELFVVKKKKIKPPSPPKSSVPSVSVSSTPRSVNKTQESTPATSTSNLGLRNSQDTALRSSQNNEGALRSSTSSGVSETPAKKSTPGELVSCIPDLNNRKPKRSVVWADQTPSGPLRPLVHIKKFPRDKNLGVNEAYMRRMQQNRLEAMQNAGNNASTATRPSIVATVSWTVPSTLPDSEQAPKRATESTEMEEQQKRVRATCKVFYPDVRHIPPSPTVVHDPSKSNSRPSNIPTIPLYASSSSASGAASHNSNSSYAHQDHSQIPIGAMATPYPSHHSSQAPAMDFQTLKSLLSNGPFSSHSQQPQQPRSSYSYSQQQHYMQQPSCHPPPPQGNNYYSRRF